MIDTFTNYTSMLVLIVGLLAFVVSVIVQVTKGLPWIKAIPTDLEVLVLSIILTLLTLFAYLSYINVVVRWYYVFGAVVAGFFVAFVTMYGWSKLTDLYARFRM